MRLLQQASGRMMGVVLMLEIIISTVSATYIPWNGRGRVGDMSAIAAGGHEKSNSVAQRPDSSTDRRRHKSVFRNDAVRTRSSSSLITNLTSPNLISIHLTVAPASAVEGPMMACNSLPDCHVIHRLAKTGVHYRHTRAR